MSSQHPPSPQLQPGTPEPNPGPYGAQPPAPQGTDPVAILGLVFAFLFWPLGLVLSLVGIGRTGRGKRAGRGLAIAGAVVSAIAGVIAVVVIAAIAGAADQASTEIDAIAEELESDMAEVEADAAAAPAPADPEPADLEPADAEPAVADDAPVEPDAADVSVGIGEPATVDGVTFTVGSEECGPTEIGDEYLSVDAQGVFCLFDVTVQNGSNEPFFFDSSSVTGFIGEAEYSSDGEAAIYLEDNDAFLEEVNPGNTIEATVVFDVPAGAQLDRLELSAGFLSFDRAVVTLR